MQAPKSLGFFENFTPDQAHPLAGQTKIQIILSTRHRQSLLDVRIYRSAKRVSDHELFLGLIRIKLKSKNKVGATGAKLDLDK